jgi:hypothetical protein
VANGKSVSLTTLLTGLILIGVLAVAPQGVTGLAARAWRGVRGAGRQAPAGAAA